MRRERGTPAVIAAAVATGAMAGGALAVALALGGGVVSAQDAAGGARDGGVGASDASDEASPPAAGARADEAEPLPPGLGPIDWAPGDGRGCHRYQGRQICDGPRRVPISSPEALDRQRALGLDGPRVAHRATSGPPPQEWVAAARAIGAAPADLRWPVDGGRLWRGYGMHQRLAKTRSGRMRRARGRRRHEGVDIGADPGTAILAANDGLVVYSDNSMHGYGNAVLLVHADGSVTLYAHCRATFVVAGDAVRRGQVIAAVGATGLAHGPHLHFEWRVGGQTRDPLPHFVERPDRSGDATSEGAPDDAHEEGDAHEDEVEPRATAAADARRGTPR